MEINEEERFKYLDELLNKVFDEGNKEWTAEQIRSRIRHEIIQEAFNTMRIDRKHLKVQSIKDRLEYLSSKGKVNKHKKQTEITTYGRV